jgi:predicted Zn-dependent protease
VDVRVDRAADRGVRRDDGLAGKSHSEDTVEGKLVRGASKLRKSFQDLDPSEEHFIGRSVAAEILAMPQYPLSTDVTQLAYVERVGHGIVETNDTVRRPFLDYRFGVLATDEVNAFACPGGLILITRGLLAQTTSEDELAAVLAHEIAHVTLRHGVAAIQKANLAEAFTYLGAGAAQATMKQEDLNKLTDLFDDSVSDIVQTMVTSGYSRDSELGRRQARTQVPERHRLRPASPRTGAGRMHGGGGMLATHPAPQDRIEALGKPLAYAGDQGAEALRGKRFAAVFPH